MDMLRNFLNAFADILYPKICLACKTKLKDKSSIDNLVCGECWGKIKKNPPPFCHSCGRHLNNPTKNICPSCMRKQMHFDRAFSPCAYEGVLKELILLFKYKNKDYLGTPLSRIMVEFIRDYNLPMDFIDLIIPVPLHKARLREREFNQAEVLSNHIAPIFNKRVLPDGLIRTRDTKTQTELEIKERLRNVRGGFTVRKSKDIESKNILLVDDVLTTGATSSEAAHTLKKAGAHIVFVLTLAN